MLPHENYRQGGSLERATTTRIKISGSTQTYAASDSEYGQYGGSGGARNSRSSCSPSSTRKYNQNTNGSGGTSSPTPSSPNTSGSCGSKSLPKGASSLNYGLMMDKNQQKRHQRQQQHQQYTPKINDGSLSDSNYVTYDQTNR